LYPFTAGESLAGQWTLIRQYGPDDTPNGIEELTPGPDGKLYGGNAQGQVFLVDPVDGGLTLVTELSGDALLAMAEGPDGRLYSATAPGPLIVFNPQSGATTVLASFTSENGPSSVDALAWGPDGQLYGGNTQGQMFTIDPTTG